MAQVSRMHLTKGEGVGEETMLLLAGGVCEGREDPHSHPAVICSGHRRTLENHLAQTAHPIEQRIVGLIPSSGHEMFLEVSPGLRVA